MTGVAVSAKKASSGPTRATAALTKADIEFDTHIYDHDPRAESYGVEAADALGVRAQVVFKTLVVKVDDELVLGVVPVASKLDLKALASAVGGRRAELAAAADAERSTGYVIGGISPIGTKSHLPTVLDSSATTLDLIYVSGGRRGLDLSLNPRDLAHYTKARIAPIAHHG